MSFLPEAPDFPSVRLEAAVQLARSYFQRSREHVVSPHSIISPMDWNGMWFAWECAARICWTIRHEAAPTNTGARDLYLAFRDELLDWFERAPLDAGTDTVQTRLDAFALLAT